MVVQEKTLDKLNRIYDKAEEVDKEVFAEMRSNVLLVSGEHYSKVNARIASNIRTSNKTQVTEQKLRLTKNHMHRASRSYVTAILSESPDTSVKPQRPTELQDKKDAELNLAVWQDTKNRHDYGEKRQTWCKSFVDIGEVCVKVTWNHTKGELKGFEPLIDENTGQPVMEPTGQMQPALHPATNQPYPDPNTGQMAMQPVMKPKDDESRPLFTGDFDFEDIYAFNLLREASTQEMYEHGRCWIVRKMVDVDELKAKFPDSAGKIHDSQHETYIVFDANKGRYDKVKDQTLVREFYWPKCEEYPKGWYVYSTKEVKLAEGELPGGIWPLVWEGFDKYATTPRGRSILKVARPYQAEINRASSQMAVAQVTLGDDKVLYQSGTKLAPGALLPGVRGISFQGMAPTVLPGRNGAQYLDYVNAQIMEMDRALRLDENEIQDKSGVMDPWAMMFRAAAKKRLYSLYIEKFQRFQIKVTKLVLELAKFYLPDDMLIPAIGVREQVNIQEFRATTPLSYQIVVEATTDTPETLFGRQLTSQQILQYVGKDLDPRTRGKLIKNMPFGNFEDSFDELTMDEDIANNEMLALERGQPQQATPYVDPAFMLKSLTNRMKKPEYAYLNPQIQQSYEQLKNQYEQINEANAQKLIDAKNEYIPTDGALVTVDFYIPDPNNPDAQARRARVPNRAIEWLLQQLAKQGSTQQQLEGMNAQAMSEMAGHLLSNQRGQQPQGQNALGMQPPMAG